MLRYASAAATAPTTWEKAALMPLPPPGRRRRARGPRAAVSAAGVLSGPRQGPDRSFRLHRPEPPSRSRLGAIRVSAAGRAAPHTAHRTPHTAHRTPRTACAARLLRAGVCGRGGRSGWGPGERGLRAPPPPAPPPSPLLHGSPAPGSAWADRLGRHALRRPEQDREARPPRAQGATTKAGPGGGWRLQRAHTCWAERAGRGGGHGTAPAQPPTRTRARHGSAPAGHGGSIRVTAGHAPPPPLSLHPPGHGRVMGHGGPRFPHAPPPPAPFARTHPQRPFPGDPPTTARTRS